MELRTLDAPVALGDSNVVMAEGDEVESRLILQPVCPQRIHRRRTRPILIFPVVRVTQRTDVQIQEVEMRGDRTAAVIRVSQLTEIRLRKWVCNETVHRSDKKAQLPQHIVAEG